MIEVRDINDLSCILSCIYLVLDCGVVLSCSL